MILVGAPAAAASPIVPLFSGQESKIWTPEHANLTKSHLVLTRPPKPVWNETFTRPGDLTKIDGVRLAKTMWPTCGRRVLSHDDEDYRTPPIEVVLSDGDDPHQAFYKVAMEMRNRFAAQSRTRLENIPALRRPYTSLVTLVDTEIFAGVLARDERGFQLEISYTPYVVDAGHHLNLNGWGVYSENGEYPIEIPTNIDMDYLFSLDTGILKGDRPLSTFGGRILLR